MTAHGPRPTRRQLLVTAAGATLLPVRAADIQQIGGAKLPAIQAIDEAGRKAAVPAAGRATIVNFWATWCPPCRAEMPMLHQLADIYGERLTLQFVNFKERAATVQRYMQQAAWTLPVLFDPAGEAAAAWNVKRFPTTFGFDAAGRPRWRVHGEYDWSSTEAARLVEGLWQG